MNDMRLHSANHPELPSSPTRRISTAPGLIALLVLPALLGGCRCGETLGADSAPGTDALPGTDAAPDAAADSATGTDGATTDAGTLACDTTATSTLPDVSIAFPAQDCVFTLAEAAAGIAIDYEVVITATVDGIVPDPQDAGQCGAPGPSGLILFENLAGGGQSYCLCDTGLCAPPSPTPVQLQPGTYASGFLWMGRNWAGPSDTGMPMGAPFPVGTYTLTASAVGGMGPLATPFDVTGTFTIHVVP